MTRVTRSPAALALVGVAILVFAAATVLVLRGPTAPAARDADAVNVHLTPWTGDAELLRMYTTVLGTANPNGRGFTLHEGIAGVSLTGDEERTVLIVRFTEGLRPARRDSLLATIGASPLVARIGP